ncbi:MAG TPA: hypothetical protein DCG32_00830 [Sphaerochaeta sp.]|nr:hypothetical protein [Sphaerochaeta sp.]
MSYTMFTEKEKLAHLEKAKANMKRGTGSFRSYAMDSGIPRSTFYKWAHAYGYCEDTQENEPDKGLVSLGKPVPFVNKELTFVVDYYGSRIEVNSEKNLVALLKGIRIAGSI